MQFPFLGGIRQSPANGKGEVGFMSSGQPRGHLGNHNRRPCGCRAHRRAPPAPTTVHVRFRERTPPCTRFKDMTFNTRLAVARQATGVVLRRLERLAPSEETLALVDSLEDCVRETKQWTLLPPTVEEQDNLMKRLVALHLEVQKLERQALLVVAIEA